MFTILSCVDNLMLNTSIEVIDVAYLCMTHLCILKSLDAVENELAKRWLLSLEACA